MKNTDITYCCDLCPNKAEAVQSDRKPVGWGFAVVSEILPEERRIRFHAGGPGVEGDICPECLAQIKTLLATCKLKRLANNETPGQATKPAPGTGTNTSIRRKKD